MAFIELRHKIVPFFFLFIYFSLRVWVLGLHVCLWVVLYASCWWRAGEGARTEVKDSCKLLSLGILKIAVKLWVLGIEPRVLQKSSPDIPFFLTFLTKTQRILSHVKGNPPQTLMRFNIALGGWIPSLLRFTVSGSWGPQRRDSIILSFTFAFG